jgi:ankyrin repeat protein
MAAADREELLKAFVQGRTELVFNLLEAGVAATYRDDNGVSLLQTCAYFGDVSAMRYLLERGEKLESLGDDYGLSAAVFHGHWRLCLFLLERGADVNKPQEDTRETPLHSALCKTDRLVYDRVLQVLLAHGANPNVATIAGVETGAFMRDCRTKGETPLHRAAAFGGEDAIKMLLNAGAVIDARDANGDTPLSWGSWYGRHDNILRLLCYGRFRIRPDREGMRADLLGKP